MPANTRKVVAMISIAEAAAPVIDHVHRVAAWRQALAGLDPLKPVRDVPLRRWQNLLRDCRWFLDPDPGWTELALDFGWTEYELFAANRSKPHARLDQCGLLWLVNRARIEEIGESFCVLVTATGARSTYRMRTSPPDEVCLPWELVQ
jgi:hypothetical protein